MEFIIAIVVIVIVLAIGAGTQSKPFTPKYRKQKSLFSPAERSFLGALDLALNNEYRVMAKVRIADLITPEKGLNKGNWQTAFNKIAMKHIDFVICDKETLEVIGCIELDDKSHNTAKVKTRDKFVNHAMKTADIPLLRMPTKRTYGLENVKIKLKELKIITTKNEPSETDQTASIRTTTKKKLTTS